MDSLLSEPIQVHCIGGFAIVAAYGLRRATNDLDYFSLVPPHRIRDLQGIAGEGSPLAQTQGESLILTAYSQSG
jgi:hypothetical protein